MNILVPTCRRLDELEEFINALMVSAPDCDIVPSCLPKSAAVNRNYCLDYLAVGDVAVMIDDDISGFYPGWVNDMVAPIVADPSVVAVSARLLNPDGTFGPTCSRCYESTPDEIEIKSNGVCIIPTAAIAFRWRGHRFDENFAGSGFEDNDYFAQILRDDPGAKFIQSNKCRLVHLNRMTNQKGKFWHHNESYFFNKWRPSRVIEKVSHDS